MVYSDKKFIANKIKEYRKRARLTQAQLGEKIGITDKHICKIENATYAPSVETFLKIVDILNISLEEFGINTGTAQRNKTRDDFIKLLHSINNKELDFLYENLQTLLNTLRKFK